MNEPEESADDFALDVQAYLEQHPEAEAEIHAEVARLRIAEELHALRIDAGLSIQEVSKQAGVAGSLVEQLEEAKGTGILLDDLIRIADFFGASISIKKRKIRRRKG
jgi:hypothetical protein